MPLHIIKGDIFDYANKADAIVVPANKYPKVGNGLDSALFKAAGYKNVMEQRKNMGVLRIGQAKETDGFKIARYLIHTASPMWLGGKSNECEKLKNCYINSIKCADRLGLKNIVFPLLSSGNMRFPPGVAYETAVQAINERLSVHDSLDVYLVRPIDADNMEYIKASQLYECSDMTLAELIQKKAEMEEYQTVDREIAWYYAIITDRITMKKAEIAQEKSFEADLQKYLAEHPHEKREAYKRERFYEYFETCGISAAKLAERIGCEKSTVSRIKNGQTLNPRKETVVALAIAMELTGEQRYDFIKCSGHAYPIDEMDYMVEQLMRDGFKNLSAINDLLYEKNHNWLLIGKRSDEVSDRKSRCEEK